VSEISFAFVMLTKSVMKVHNKKSLVEIRRNLRIASFTNPENIFWKHVRNGQLEGLKFKRQRSIGNHIVDFYCASERLIIELDGSVHNSKEQKEKDKFRDENLRDMDFKVLRFKNQEIFTKIDDVKQRIINVVNPSKA
jgi:very-short-patch-repair endonuclease